MVAYPHLYSQASPISDSMPFLYDNIQHAIRQDPIWQKDLLQHFCIHDIDILFNDFQRHDDKLYIVSDGGAKDNRGSFGVSIGIHDSELVSIEGPAPGYSEHANLYRSEAYGM